MRTEFYACNGATERKDRVLKLSKNNYVLVYGFGKDSDGNGYSYRKYYDHKPSESELKEDIVSLVNGNTDKAILNGYSWDGKPVYLSTENQFNFKAAYDMAVQTGGESLPVTFKLGEAEDGTPQYHTFEKLEEFTEFYTGALAFVQEALNEGWMEKDSMDYVSLANSVE
jgi:hypothetical protein